MANRYDNTKKVKNIMTGKKYYKTTTYMKVPERNDDMYFISQEGDRLDNLAYRFYGDSSLWWFIARVNNLKSMNLSPGISLRIPSSIEKAEGF